MNLNKFMHQVDAHYDAVQALLERKQEEADEDYDFAEEAMHRELTFDDLLEELDNLPDQIKEEALKEAEQGKATRLLVDTYEIFLEKKTGHLLDRAIFYTRQINHYNATSNHFYLHVPEMPRNP